MFELIKNCEFFFDKTKKKTQKNHQSMERIDFDFFFSAESNFYSNEFNKRKMLCRWEMQKKSFTLSG